MEESIPGRRKDKHDSEGAKSEHVASEWQEVQLGASGVNLRAVQEKAGMAGQYFRYVVIAAQWEEHWTRSQKA